MRRQTIMALSICMLPMLGGCASHTFVPGPGMSAIDFEPDAARCRLFARSADPSYSFGASGSPKFVAASMGAQVLGATIATAVRENQNFNDCMEARGWRIADHAAAPTPTVTADAPAAAATPAVAVGPAVAPTVPAIPVAANVPSVTPPPLPHAESPARSVTSSPAPAAIARRPLLVGFTSVTEDRAVAEHLPSGRGLFVMSVQPGGVGAACGLRGGDIILMLNGARTDTVADVQQALATVQGNMTVQSAIWRDQQELVVNLTF
jgi:hypothetical protein